METWECVLMWNDAMLCPVYDMWNYAMLPYQPTTTQIRTSNGEPVGLFWWSDLDGIDQLSISATVPISSSK